jgi:hypothetical protein
VDVVAERPGQDAERLVERGEEEGGVEEREERVVSDEQRRAVRLDVLEEIDGPMLQHGLQGFQNRRIHVPRADHLKPNRDFLAERFELFRKAG